MMDPIVAAGESLMTHLEHLWMAHPGRVVPVVAAPTERLAVVHVLRGAELDGQAPVPVVVHEDPFVDTTSYLHGLAEALRRDYDARAAHISWETLAVPGFTGVPSALPPLERVMMTLERTFAALYEALGGLVVARVPERIEEPEKWRKCALALDEMVRPAGVRLAIFMLAGEEQSGLLGGFGARFAVDPYGVFAGLVATGALNTERLLVPSLGERMRHGDWVSAMALCGTMWNGFAVEGRPAEQAAVGALLGALCLAQQAMDVATHHYRKAAELAEGEQAWVVANLAWSGVGAALRMRGLVEAAATSYGRAVEAARRAEALALHVEALRMVGTCLADSVDLPHAVDVWRTALQVAEAANEPEGGVMRGRAYIRRALERLGHPQVLGARRDGHPS